MTGLALQTLSRLRSHSGDQMHQMGGLALQTLSRLSDGAEATVIIIVHAKGAIRLAS